MIKVVKVLSIPFVKNKGVEWALFSCKKIEGVRELDIRI